MLIKLSLVYNLLTINGQVHMRYGRGLDLEVHPAFVQPSVKWLGIVYNKESRRIIWTEESATLEHLVIRPVTSVLETLV